MQTVRKSLMMLAFCALSGGVFAAVGQKPVTVIPLPGAEKKAYQLADVDKITFAGDRMQVHIASGEIDELPLAEIEKIVFDAELEAVNDMSADVGALRLTVADRVVSARVDDGGVIVLTLFDASGRALCRQAGKGSCSIDLKPYPAGVYILKANDKSIKVRN